ncbi:MAG: pantoate--beta-alanine ligase [Bacteroidetes bacterium]|nr:pantoate--beta-alanine ligase [Bacteroidota bacterium]
MKQFSSIPETAEYLRNERNQGLTIGFVPTMGALHEGHLDLIRRSKRENDLTVCSIFVNPIQFNNKEDLAKYPRSLARDSILLEESGCDLVFAPEAEEMYPDQEPASLNLSFGMLDKVMEGKFRPGHFNGVAIVVKKLFDIVQPTCAYFGKKDYQQLAIIRYMVNTLGLPVKLIPCETIRDADGLAMSSRNARLTVKERSLAPEIYAVLLQVKKAAGNMNVNELKEWAINKLQEHTGFRVEYFEIGDKDSLMPLADWDNKNKAVAFIAVFLGDVRLIDNVELFL